MDVLGSDKLLERVYQTAWYHDLRFFGSVAEDARLVTCDTLSLAEWLSTFAKVVIAFIVSFR
jgi:hypothetical protein